MHPWETARGSSRLCCPASRPGEVIIVAKPATSLNIALYWLDPPKVWRIEWFMPAGVGPGVISHHRRVESTVPVDVFTARAIVDAIEKVLREHPLW